MAAFYSDLNGWLATASEWTELKPTDAEVDEVFSNSAICSDVSDTANDGVATRAASPAPTASTAARRRSRPRSQVDAARAVLRRVVSGRV